MGSPTLRDMELSGEAPRWQGQESSFPWEQDALDHIKAKMPEAEPYRAWQTFTFTAGDGHVREVDLFVATPGGLFLIEIKSHPGHATNDGDTWLFRDGNTTRTIDNPLHFTDQKSKELRGQLQRAADDLNTGLTVPRVEPAVFLSAENLVCHFDQFQRQRIYGREGKKDQTNLGGIWTGLLDQPPRSENSRVTQTLSKQLPRLLQKIGIARLHKIGRVGPYELDSKQFDAGPTWQDYLARNPALPADHPRRVRIYLTERTASEAERKSVQRAARREYLALQGITHDGIVRAEQYSDELLLGPAVVFQHGRDWQRLDHFMAARHDELALETRLEMIRQLAEALGHAHRRHLYHRALAPRAVYVELDGRYPRLKIADWQVAARPHGTTGTATLTTSAGVEVGTIFRHVERSAAPYLAPEFRTAQGAALLDVFGLGALSYLILTSEPPAATREQLAARLNKDGALVPSSVADSANRLMDDLVRGATRVHPADRTESVRQFLRNLDAIEDDLTGPQTRPSQDPLTAKSGDEIQGWAVKQVLGKGSTSRALLVGQANAKPRVFKVALNEAAARRLDREAAQLAQLTDSHVARLLNPPFEEGPQGHKRKIIGVEYIEGDTLAEELHRNGPLTINELERLGEDLFQALGFLDKRGVWHRDIKPANLALRPLDRKGRELVLLDFSLAGVPDTDLGVGTQDYLDPFLGDGRRDRYDQAAELYAVAVTLHEMASGELPSWGDGEIEPLFLAPGEEVQLAEDLFDPVARDGLVEFFRTALARDVGQRFGSLREMTRAWTRIFEDLETIPPLTTSSTVGADEAAAEDDLPGDPAAARATRQAEVQARRDEAVRKAAPGTPLAAAGLSPHALSTALGKLGVSTAGELARVPARRITGLRGIGSGPRYELVRQSRQWRQQFNLAEADIQAEEERHQHDNSSEWTPVPAPGSVSPPAVAERPEELARLSVDDVLRRLVPDVPELRRVTGVARPADGRPVSPWASPQEMAARTGIPAAETGAHLGRLRARWKESVPALASIRDDMLAILGEHGRILGWRQLAAALLARRGSELSDPAERLNVAAICVRAVVDTEEHLQDPLMLSRKADASGEVVLVALTEQARQDAAEDPAPRADDLFAYAELLGEQAGLLAGRDPLPGVTEIRQALREVDTADHAVRLSDTDLVLLAAAASGTAAASPRLELYPRDLPPARALKLSQAGSTLLHPASEADLVSRVLARFPDLTNPPRAEHMRDLLKNAGYEARRDSKGLLSLVSATQTSASRGFGRASSSATAARLGLTHAEFARQRLDEARRRGGFVAVKASIHAASAVCDELARMEGVTAVNVTASFVAALKQIREDAGRPHWETVLAADSTDASPAARAGFARLVGAAWQRLEAHVAAVGNGGIVLLHDAAPLARYGGGGELLARLAVAARQAEESPRGLWLFCPMQSPKDSPRLDSMTVAVIPGDAEQLFVHDSFADSQGDRKAS
jgi:serine/threonine protein kinase